jgi:predicted nucleotidyltransferase
MPSFTSYVETDVDVDIDVEEFIDQCSDEDIDEIIQILIEQGRMTKLFTSSKHSLYTEQVWNETLNKLLINRLSLTNEEIEIIEKIVKRF